MRCVFNDGHGFVTAVPGARIQIVGRRDPRTGELRVLRVCAPLTTEADDRHFAALASAAGWEIVTGAEAERLIERVYKEIKG
jgi:hypothetical protein